MVRPPRQALGSLTGLRAVAAFAVFWYHIQWMAPGLYAGGNTAAADALNRVALKGYIGVSFFFVLSGFVLAWSHCRGDRASRFWARRAVRLYPNHIATWLVSAILVITGIELAPPLLPAFANLLLLPHVIFGGEWTLMNDPSWSIEVEAFFYLVFPLVLARIALFPAHRLVRPLVGAAAISIGLPILVIASGHGTDEGFWRLLYFFPLFRLPEFVVGICLGLLARREALPKIRVELAWLAVAVAVGLVVVAPIPLTFAAITLLPFAALLSAYAVRDLDGRSGRLAGRAWTHLGEISFAFYLCHYLVIRTIRAPFDDQALSLPLAAALTVASFVGSIVAAEVLHQCVELPVARRLRPRLGTTPAASPAADR